MSIGLTDAYFHIPIHEKSQHFLRFHVAGKTYQFRALPFGIATAPLKFSRVVKEVKLMLQNRGIHIHQYLDDWLLRAPSEEICLQQSKQLVAFVQELGWVINFQKSELKPTPNFDFLGYRFDLTKGQVSPTEKKWQILKKAIHQLQNSLTTTPRVLMSLIGVLALLEKTVSMGRLHMRPFQWYLKTHWRYPQSLDMKIPCSEILKSHLNWWRDPNNELIGTPLHAEEHNLLLFTDASVKGWGAHLEDQTVSGLWSYTEKNLHINVLVLKAVFLAIRSFQSHLLNKRVLVASDNVTVVSYLNKQGRTHSLEMCLMIWRLMAFCKPRAILLRARHIQGCLIWHRPMVDMFATKMNNKLPLYVSPVPDPNAMAIDALNISWQALDSYAYCYNRIYTNRMVSSSKDISEDLPNLAQTNGRYVCNQDEQQATSLCISSPRPKCNSNRCIEYLVAGSRRLCLLSHSSDTKNDSKMKTYACQMIVIAPGWPGMSWFWDLIELSTKPPLLLPHWEILLKQPFSQRFHQNLQYLNLHAWHLDSRLQFLKNSQSQWQRELRRLKEFHPERSMNQGGPFLNHGAKRIRWTSTNLLYPQ